MKALGENMRHIRKIKGLTQEELAKKAGLSTMSIRRYENGERIITEKALYRIANALEVQMYDFSSENDAIDTDQFPWWPLRPPRIMTEKIKTIHIPMPEYPLSLPTKEQVDRMTQPELEYYHLRLLADDAPDELRKRYIDNYDRLNKLGQVEAVIRTKELTRLHEYTGRDIRAETAPQSPPAPQEGQSTTPPPDAPETPPGGE